MPLNLPDLKLETAARAWRWRATTRAAVNRNWRQSGFLQWCARCAEVLNDLLEYGDDEELHLTIERHCQQTLEGQRPRARRH
jgi:hypothetical protein